MQTSYAAGIAQQAIVYLTDDKELIDRLYPSISELGVITNEDVSPELFTRIQDLDKIDLRNNNDLKSISFNVASLCCDIIKEGVIVDVE